MKITPESVAAMKQKVFIAIPQHELSRYTSFEVHLDGVICPPYTIKQRICGIYIANLQNGLARMFLASECEWFWLLNDDQPYPADTLLHLLACEKDIVVPLCLEKAAPHYPLIYDKGDNGLKKHRFLRNWERGLIKVAASGGGGMLIHRRVFEAIPDPWWTVTTKQAENGVWEQSSEDFDFCDKVAAAGFQMYCDLDTSVIHIAHYGLRAMIDERSGEWRTVLLREEEQIVLPAATPPPSPIEIHQHFRKELNGTDRIHGGHSALARFRTPSLP